MIAIQIPKKYSDRTSYREKKDILMIRQQRSLNIFGGNMAELLKIKDLSVSVEEKGILKNVNLSINKGETHVLMGPNGAGKSTLGNALMGNPRYQWTDSF